MAPNPRIALDLLVRYFFRRCRGACAIQSGVVAQLDRSRGLEELGDAFMAFRSGVAIRKCNVFDPYQGNKERGEGAHRGAGVTEPSGCGM